MSLDALNGCSIALGTDTSEAAKAKARNFLNFDSEEASRLLSGGNSTKPAIKINHDDNSKLFEKKDTTEVMRTGYLVPAKPQQIVDKNGVVREGFIVENEPPSFEELLSGKQRKPLATVKAEQVNKFLESIKALGLNIKAEDIMSSTGVLNPNFKVDDKGNISFRNIKDYINGKSPEYFETSKGQWAQAAKKTDISWIDDIFKKLKPKDELPKIELPRGFKLDDSGIQYALDSQTLN